jgi:hypothetical protein
MKTIKALVLFAIISTVPLAADLWESYEIIDRLLTLPGPVAPVIHDDFVIFTASSDFRRVGVAFAHEKFSNVHWFRPLFISQDRLNAPIPPGQREPDPFKNSGILFHVFQVPENLNELEYRLVINGLWTVDPANNYTRRDPVSGLALSVLPVPARRITPNPLRGLPAGLNFSFNGPPGEIVTVAGSFNNWDPFMYELKEHPAGVYSITIPLPPGAYQYVFFNRGERFVDPYNPRRVYARNGAAVSEIIVP